MLLASDTSKFMVSISPIESELSTMSKLVKTGAVVSMVLSFGLSETSSLTSIVNNCSVYKPSGSVARNVTSSCCLFS